MTTLPAHFTKTYKGMSYGEWKAQYDRTLAMIVPDLNEDDYDINRVESYNPRSIFNERRSPNFAVNAALADGLLD